MKRSSLAEERPDLLDSWSPNNEISPYDITCGSTKKVLWRCKKDHEWAATVKNRALLGSGCPYCGCRAVLKGFNDLATIHPELINEWSEKNEPLKPTDVASCSNRKVWWCCSEGHEWKARIADRTSGHGCPYCAGERVWIGFNDLQTTHPDIAQEWSELNLPILPTAITSKSRLNVWWHCKNCDEDYKAVIDSRVKGLVCPHCISKERERIRQEHKLTKAIYKDFKYYLPQLAVIYYAGQKGMRVILDDSDLVGLPLTAYIPDISLVIDVCTYDKAKRYKGYILRKRKIDYHCLSDDLTEEQILGEIRHIFYQKHVFSTESTIEDVNYFRGKYAILAQKRRFPN